MVISWMRLRRCCVRMQRECACACVRACVCVRVRGLLLPLLPPFKVAFARQIRDGLGREAQGCSRHNGHDAQVGRWMKNVCM